MTKKLKINCLISFITAVLLCTLGGIHFLKSERAQAATISGWYEATSFEVGTTLNVPDGSKIDVDGTLIDVSSAIIISPDGVIKELKDYVCTLSGEYTVRYQGTHEGQSVVAEKKFMVLEGVYVSKTPATTAQYKTTEEFLATTTMPNVPQTAKLYAGNQPAESVIDVALATGDCFKFNKVVNVYDLAKENQGVVDVCTVYPGNRATNPNNYVNRTDSSDGVLENASVDAVHFSIKLVDCYDETNYLEFMASVGTGKNYTGFRLNAGASNQILTGLQKTEKDYGPNYCTIIDGQLYQRYKNERYQTATTNGTVGKRYDLMFSSSVRGLQFYWDTTNNAIYTNDGLLVTMLDHEITNPGNPFGGFTTGEVYFEVSFQLQTSNPTHVAITSILGMSGEELNNSDAYDTTPPQIKLDSNYSSENSIFLAKGTEFAIPTAEVVDVNSTGNCDVAVYYNYGTSVQTLCSVKNGKFIPKAEGVYTIVYSSTDRFGNRGEKLLNVICTRDRSFTFNEQNKLTAINAYTNVLVPVLKPTSLNGNPSESITIIDPNGNRRDITLTSDGEHYSFIPELLGDYTVEYTLKDRIYTEIYSYTVPCTGLSAVQFVDQLPLPTTIIRNAYYDFQDYYAHKANDGAMVKLLGQYQVSTNGGASYEAIGDHHKYLATVADGVTALKFRVACEGEYSSVWEANVVDVKLLERKKEYVNYFYGPNTVTLNDESAICTFDESNGSISYATPFALKAFALKFNLSEGNYSKISIRLREVGLTKDSGYVVSYEQQKDGVLYTVKSYDGKITYHTSTLTGTLVRDYAFTMSGDELVSAENVRVKLPTLAAKDVELSMSFESDSPFTVNVVQVGNQVFNRFVSRRNEAAVQVLYTASSVAPGLGDEYTLPNLYVSSVLYPTSTASLKITLLDGKNQPISDNEGNLIEKRAIEFGNPITLNIPSIGTFIARFEYTNFDRTDMTETEINLEANYVFESFDFVSPTVAFEGKLSEERAIKIQKGTLYQFVGFTATDDITPSEELSSTYFVWNETNNLVAWGVTEYAFTKPGNYKIYVYVRDASNNATSVYYNLIVEGEDDSFVQTEPGSTTIREEREDGTIVTKRYFLGVHELNFTERANDYFVKNNESEYAILVPSADKITANLQIAIREFNTFLSESTGVMLPIVYESGDGYTQSSDQKFISFGNTNLAQSNGITATLSEMKNNGYIIRTVENNVFIVAAADSGLINGVYGFFDIVANYEIYSGEVYHLDKLTDIKLLDFDVKDIPDVDYSLAEWGFMHDDGDDEIALRFRMEGGSTIMMAGDRKYSDSFREVHNSNLVVHANNPDVEGEWFAQGANQLCYTARGDAESLDRMIQHVTDVLIDNIKLYPVTAYPEKNSITLSCMDGGGCCNCDACVAEKNKYGSDVASVIKFCNRVMEKVLAWMSLPENEAYDRGENFYLLYFAYANYKECPAHFDETLEKYVLNGDLYIHPQVATWLTPMDLQSCFSMYDPVNDKCRETLVAWQDVSTAIFYWTWNHAFQSPALIRDTYSHYSSELYQFYMSANPIEYKEENAPTMKMQTGFQQLRSYLTSKLSWDSSLDEAQLTDEWFKAMYGVCAPQMRALYDDMRIHEYYLMDQKYGIDKLVNNINLYTKEYWSMSSVLSWIEQLEKAYEINEKVNKIAHPETYELIKLNIDYQYYYPAKAILTFYSPAECGAKYYDVVKYLQENDAFFSSGFRWNFGQADNGNSWRNIIVE